MVFNDKHGKQNVSRKKTYLFKGVVAIYILYRQEHFHNEFKLIMLSNIYAIFIGQKRLEFFFKKKNNRWVLDL